jgi:hypothetical protein
VNPSRRLGVAFALALALALAMTLAIGAALPATAASASTTSRAHHSQGWRTSRDKRFAVTAVLVLVAIWIFEGAPGTNPASPTDGDGVDEHRARISLYELPPRQPDRGKSAHRGTAPPLR